MTDDTILPFSFPAVHAKKVTAAFDGGRLTSNGGVMLLAMAERRLGLADNLARVFPDRRDPTRVVHSLVDMFRARMFAICCGYEDADDLDHLRSDPAFKLACGRLPDSGRDLCSQPTLSRLENAPRLRDVIRLTYTLVDAWMDIVTLLGPARLFERAAKGKSSCSRRRRRYFGRRRSVADIRASLSRYLPPPVGCLFDDINSQWKASICPKLCGLPRQRRAWRWSGGIDPSQAAREFERTAHCAAHGRRHVLVA